MSLPVNSSLNLKRLPHFCRKQFYLSVVALVIFHAEFATPAESLEIAVASPAEVKSFDEARIPADAIVAFTVFPNRLLKLPGVELLPLELISAKSEEELGFDPLSVERLDIAVGLPAPGASALSIGAIVTLNADASIEDLSKDIVAGPIEKKFGINVRRMKDKDFFIGSIDARHHVVGTINYVNLIVKGKNGPSILGKLCTQIKPQSDLNALVSLDPLMPMIEGIVEGKSEQMPPALAGLAQAMVSHAQYIVLSSDFQGLFHVAGFSDRKKEKSRLIIETKTDAGAVELAKAWESAMDFGIAILKEQMVLADESQKIQQASKQWLARFVPAMKNLVKPQQQGKQVIIETDSTSLGLPGVGVMTGMLLPSIQQAREEARRVACMNNLRQIGFAMLNYESTYQKLPAASTIDAATSKRLLSWRVMILPFIEENELYKQFKLDEPWDSPHNIQLVDKMPAAYKCPAATVPNGKTTYLAVSSQECGILPTTPTRLASFTDGLSNSLLCVEVADQHAVPWTAPMDFDATPESIEKMLGSNHSGGFNVLFCDCSVRFLSTALGVESTRAYSTRDGNEIVP